VKFKRKAKFLYNKLLNAHSEDSRTSQAIIEKNRLISYRYCFGVTKTNQ